MAAPLSTEPIVRGNERVVVLGGGLAGISTALALKRAGVEVTLVEARGELGGLAGSFEVDGRFYPLGYHHILDRDAVLRRFLEEIGVAREIEWRRVRMLFETESEGSQLRLWNLADPRDLLRFPLGFVDKARLARLLLRSSRRDDWSAWVGRGADELLDSWGSPAIRRALFEPLTQLKFGLAAKEVSAAWVGARLYYREGRTPLGYLPRRNWTKVLCDGLTRLLEEVGVEIVLRAPIESLRFESGRVVAAKLADGRELEGDRFVSTLPVPVYHRLAPEDRSATLASIRYTALLSAVCAVPRVELPEFYWLNLSSLRHTASALFQLSSLNPTIGAAGELCLNFVTHLPSSDFALFRAPDDELGARYAADFERLFGLRLEPAWMRISRVAMYSPVFDRDYRNPPLESATYPNLLFAGNYRTFPSVASTGTALGSGLEAAARLLGVATGSL